MQLIVLDTILITAIARNPLRTGEKIDVSDQEGKDLLKRHPGFFAAVDEVAAQEALAVKPARKKPAIKA